MPDLSRTAYGIERYSDKLSYQIFSRNFGRDFYDCIFEFGIFIKCQFKTKRKKRKTTEKLLSSFHLQYKVCELQIPGQGNTTNF